MSSTDSLSESDNDDSSISVEPVPGSLPETDPIRDSFVEDLSESDDEFAISETEDVAGSLDAEAANAASNDDVQPVFKTAALDAGGAIVDSSTDSDNDAESDEGSTDDNGATPSVADRSESDESEEDEKPGVSTSEDADLPRASAMANENIDLEKLAEELDVSESEDEDIVQIFGGNSDDESDVPLERDVEEEVSSSSRTAHNKAADADETTTQDSNFVSDFDLIMESRKKERRMHRRVKNIDFINDSDDRISRIVDIMNKAAKDDRLSNVQQKPAIAKRKLLPTVVPVLKRVDWMPAFIDSGGVNCISEWLQLLPDKSLPAYEVRHALLKLLESFPAFDASVLRASNIGKVVALLSKHPRETKENKAVANKLLVKWVRPILNLETNYSCLSHADRALDDDDRIPAAKKSRLGACRETTEEEETALMENVPAAAEADNIPRARVPKPSTRDYVIRPKWSTDVPFSKKGRAKSSPMDKRLRELKDRMKAQKSPSSRISLSRHDL